MGKKKNKKLTEWQKEQEEAKRPVPKPKRPLIRSSHRSSFEKGDGK